MATVDNPMEIEVDRGPGETPLTRSPTSAVEPITSDDDKAPSSHEGDATVTLETDVPKSMAEDVNNAAEEIPKVESVSLPDAVANEDSPEAQAASDAQADGVTLLENPEIVDNPDNVDEPSPTQKNEFKPQVNDEANATDIAAVSVESQAGSSEPITDDGLEDDMVFEGEYEEEVVEEEFVDESYNEDEDPIPEASVQEDASPEPQDMVEDTASNNKVSKHAAETVSVSVDLVDASKDVEEPKSSSGEAVTVKDEVWEPEPTPLDDVAASEPMDVPAEPAAIGHGAVAEPKSSTEEKVVAADPVSSTVDKDLATEDVEKLELSVEQVVETAVAVQAGPQIDVVVPTVAPKESDFPVEVATTEPVYETLETEPSFEPAELIQDDAVVVASFEQGGAAGASEEVVTVSTGTVETVEEGQSPEKRGDVKKASDDRGVEPTLGPSLLSDETPVFATERVGKEHDTKADLPAQTHKILIPSAFAGVPTETNLIPSDPPASPVKKLPIPAAFGGTPTDRDSQIDMPLVTSPRKVAIPSSFSGVASIKKADVIYEPPHSPSKKVEIPLTFSCAPKEGVSPPSEVPKSASKKLAIPAVFGGSDDEDEIDRPIGSPSRKGPDPIVVDDHANASLSPHRLSIPATFEGSSPGKEEPFDAAPASPTKKQLDVPAAFGGEFKAKTPFPRPSGTIGLPDESSEQVLTSNVVAGGGNADSEQVGSPSRTLKKVVIPAVFGSGSQRPEGNSGSTPASSSIAKEEQSDLKAFAQEAPRVSISAAFSENLPLGGAKIAVSNTDSCALSQKKKLAIPSAFGGPDGPEDEHEDNRSPPPPVAVKKVLIPSTFGTSSHEPKEKLGERKTSSPKKAVATLPVSSRVADESTKPSIFKTSHHEKEVSLPPEAVVGGIVDSRLEEGLPGVVAVDNVDGQQTKKLAVPAAFRGDVKATLVESRSAPHATPSAPVDSIEGQQKKKLAIPAAFRGESKASSEQEGVAHVEQSLPKKKLAIPSMFGGETPPDIVAADVDVVASPAEYSSPIKKKLAIPAAFGGSTPADKGSPLENKEQSSTSPEVSTGLAKKPVIPVAFGGGSTSKNADVPQDRGHHEASRPGPVRTTAESMPVLSIASETEGSGSPVPQLKVAIPAAFNAGEQRSGSSTLSEKGGSVLPVSKHKLAIPAAFGAGEKLPTSIAQSVETPSEPPVPKHKVAIPAAFGAVEKLPANIAQSVETPSEPLVPKHKVAIPAAFGAVEKLPTSITRSVETPSEPPVPKRKVAIPAAFGAVEKLPSNTAQSVETPSEPPVPTHKVAIPAAFSASEQMPGLSTHSLKKSSGLPVAGPNVAIPTGFVGGSPARSLEKTQATTSKDHASVSISSVFASKGAAAPTAVTEVSNVPHPIYADRKSIETERKRLEAELERLKELEKQSLLEEIRRLEEEVEAVKAQAETEAKDLKERDCTAATVETPAKSADYEDKSLWHMLDEEMNVKSEETDHISSSSLHSEPGRIPPVPSTKEPRIDEDELFEAGMEDPVIQAEVVSPTTESSPSEAEISEETGRPEVETERAVVKTGVEDGKVGTEAPVVQHIKAQADNLSDPPAIAADAGPEKVEKKQVAWKDNQRDAVAGAEAGARAGHQKAAGVKPQGREELSPSRDVEQTVKPNPPHEERPISAAADAACGCVIM